MHEIKPNAFVLEIGHAVVKGGVSGIAEPVSATLNRALPLPYGNPPICGKAGCRAARRMASEAAKGKSVAPVEEPYQGGNISDEALFEALLVDVITATLNEVLPESRGADAVGEGILRDAPRRIFVCESVFPRAEMQQWILTWAFERLGLEAVQFGASPVLALLGMGVESGVAVDLGHNGTQVVGVCSGGVQAAHVKRNHYAGETLSARLQDELRRMGIFLSTARDVDVLHALKHKVLEVSPQPQTSFKKSSETDRFRETFYLPDGSAVVLNEERFAVCEELFSLRTTEGSDLPSLVLSCIQSLPLDLRREHLKHIYLAGGTSLLPGLPARLQSELARGELQFSAGTSTAPLGPRDVVVSAPSMRHLAGFKGGSLCALLWESDQAWVTKEYYNENGYRRTLQKLHSVKLQ